MFKIIAVGVGTIITAVLAYATTRPDTFRVERSIEIAAPPAEIHAILSDLRQWPRWSPWEQLDPEMKRTYLGAESGTGARYEWDGNRKAGAGRMEIIDSEHPERVAIALNFLRPFESANTAEFTLTPVEGGTHVTWAMHGPAGYMSKLMTVFSSFDRMMGPDFDRGLATLRKEAEKQL